MQGFGSLSGGQMAGLGVAGLAGALPLLFGGNDTGVQNAIEQLQKGAQTASGLATTLGEQGQNVLQPVAQYLKDVTGTNRQALLQATMPQRRRVIDQYATARRSLAEFTPRGGGQAAAGAELAGKQASDLAATTATARQQGFEQAGALGLNLQGMGLNAQSLATSDLNSILRAEEIQQQMRAGGWSAAGQALGTIAGSLLL